MNLFKKNKENKIETREVFSYNTWSDEIGFLFFILERKKKLYEKYFIEILGNQMDGKDNYIVEDLVTPKIEECVMDVMDSLSKKYKEFLIEKYFGTESSLVKFVSEDIYNDFIDKSIEKNNQKISSVILEKNINKIKTFNNFKN